MIKTKKFSVLRTKICTKKLEKLKKLEGFGTQWSNLLDFAEFCEILNDFFETLDGGNKLHSQHRSKIFHFPYEICKKPNFLEIFECVFPSRINLVVPLWIQLSKYGNSLPTKLGFVRDL